MNQSDTFIKDIENYFLTLSEKGLMLSSKDYFLIREWMERGFSKEQVFGGIRDAFETKTRDKIRNLFDCKEYVENSEIKSDRSETLKNDVVETRLYIDQLIDNFNKLIINEKQRNLLILHNKFKSELSNLNPGDSNLFGEINRIEEEYFNQFVEYLDQPDRLNIKNKIDEALSTGNDYINEEAKKKSLNIHLKNLIIEEYIFFNPFDIDNNGS